MVRRTPGGEGAWGRHIRECLDAHCGTRGGVPRRRMLSDVNAVARHLPSPATTPLTTRVLARAVAHAMDEYDTAKPSTQVHMAGRLRRHANLVWCDWLGLADPVPAGLFTARVRRLHRRQREQSHAAPARRAFTDDECDRLKRAAEAVGPQAAVLIHTLASTGLRIGAVQRLTWANVDVPHGRLRVLEKNGRPHTTILSPETARWLERWRACQRRPAGAVHVFASSARRTLPDTPLSQVALRRRFQRICRLAGVVGPHTHPHTFRRTVAQALWRAGNAMEHISKFLGHRHVATTDEYYLAVGVEDVLPRLAIPWMQPQ